MYAFLETKMLLPNKNIDLNSEVCDRENSS